MGLAMTIFCLMFLALMAGMMASNPYYFNAVRNMKNTMHKANKANEELKKIRQELMGHVEELQRDSEFWNQRYMELAKEVEELSGAVAKDAELIEQYRKTKQSI